MASRILLLIPLLVFTPTASATPEIPATLALQDPANPWAAVVKAGARNYVDTIHWENGAKYKIPRCPTGYHRNANGVCRIILPRRE